MSWKKFFKQNLMKSLILILVLLVISTLITFIIPSMSGIQTYGIPFSRGGDGYFPPKTYVGIGFPLMFYAYTYGGWPGNVNSFPPLYNYYNFIIDVIFWYLISCLMILIYNKLKIKIKEKKKCQKSSQLI